MIPTGVDRIYVIKVITWQLLYIRAFFILESQLREKMCGKLLDSVYMSLALELKEN